MKKNLVIYMADSIRRDYFPEFEEGITVNAIAEGKNTPQSFPSILSGLGPEEHGVTWFDDITESPTVLNMDQRGMNTAYWDHPDSPMYRVLNHRNRKTFNEMEEPFVWVKRDTVSHLPYGESWEQEGELGEDAEQDSRAREWAELFHVLAAVESGELDESGEFNYIERYKEGIEKSKQKFLDVVEEAREKGVYEDTLFVYCTDHGDSMPEDQRKPVGHSMPVEEVINVKAHFINADEEVVNQITRNGEIELKDILDVWKKNWGMIRSGLDVKNSRLPGKDIEV